MSEPPAGPWAILGIAPTRDDDAIRRAYAARLKVTRPDIDPAGFRALRDAFEMARRGARQPGPPPKPAPSPAATSEASAATGSATAQFMNTDTGPPFNPPREWPVRSLLRAGKLLEASQAWAAAVAASEISMADQAALQSDIAVAARAAPNLAPDELNEMIAAMRWEAAARDYDAPEAYLDLLHRRAAEAWFAELSETAARKFGPFQFAWRRRARGARLMLRPAPGPARRRLPYVFSNQNVSYWIFGAARHQRFLAGRLDPARVAWCRRTTRADARAVALMFRLAIVFLLFTTAATIIDAAIQFPN